MLEGMTELGPTCWTPAQLRAEIDRFRLDLVAAQKSPHTVDTYAGRAEIFVRYLEGSYVP